MRVKILLWGDSKRQSEFLRNLLGGYSGFEVVGICTTVREAAEMAVQHKPDLGIVQVALPGFSGYELSLQWKEACPDMRILWISPFRNEEYLLGALRSGAKGYLLDDAPPHKLLEGIADVLEGGMPIAPQVTKHLIFVALGLIGLADYKLSDRERNILKNLVDGMPIKLIAPKVFLSEDGVKKNLHNIYVKLGVNNGKEAVAKAIRERIV